jgi:hypothetical protein
MKDGTSFPTMSDFFNNKMNLKTFIMKLTTKAALVILSVAVIAGCKKDDNKNNAVTKTQLLTSGGWKLTSDYYDPSVDYDGNGTKENEVINFYSPCDKDDVLTFKTNGTVVSDEGATKCDPTDPQIISTTNWRFSDNETKLWIGDPGNDDAAQLIELSATVLKVKVSVTYGTITYTETLTFGH